MNALIFFTIFFIIHGLVNYYIFIHGFHAIPGIKIARIFYSVVFIFFFLSSLIEMFLYRFPDSPHVRLMHWTGSLWYGFMTYFLLSLLFIDFVRITFFLFRIDIQFISKNYDLVKVILFFTVIAAVSGIMYRGYINGRELRITELPVQINKDAGKLRSLNIVMISDIHINRITGGKRMKMIAEKINSLNPDIILVPGDIVDSYILPFVEENIGTIFKGMKSKYGIYATTGNHEFYGNLDETIAVLESCGIKFLRDRTALIDNSFFIVGREDRTGEKYYRKTPRLSLSELMKPADSSLPVILMDHTPSDLRDAYLNGVDLQISGHTHAGQLFPYNEIVKMIFEVAWGYTIKGSTNYYVSCGVGSWGPPVRIGSFSEIVNIRIKFNGADDH